MKYKFPKEFWWGSATAAPQCEGAIDVDGKSLNVFEYWFQLAPGRFYERKPVLNDFYFRYKEDIKLAKDVNYNSLRTSFQWTRILPDGKNVNEKAIIFYRKMLNEMIKNNITPLICLHHFDLPQWAMEIGGWENKKVVDAFLTYTKVCFERFGDLVKHWFTFNEPNMPINRGYLYLGIPPEVVDMKQALRAQLNMLIAHQRTVEFYHRNYKDGEIGLILNITPALPRSQNIADVEAANIADDFQWRWFLDPIVKNTYPKKILELAKKYKFMPEEITDEDWQIIFSSKIDVLGVNYYAPQRVKAVPYIADFKSKAISPLDYFYLSYSEFPGRRMNVSRGREIYPKALYITLMKIKEEYGNIKCFVSENGIAVMNENRYRDKKTNQIQDDYRISFLSEHLAWVSIAISQGVNCVGYHMWTYIDNWSWINAYKNRYGIYELNLDTKERIPKKSASWFKNVINKSEVEFSNL